jgi:hypothetical protein
MIVMEREVTRPAATSALGLALAEPLARVT